MPPGDVSNNNKLMGFIPIGPGVSGTLGEDDYDEWEVSANGRKSIAIESDFPNMFANAADKLEEANKLDKAYSKELTYRYNNPYDGENSQPNKATESDKDNFPSNEEDAQAFLDDYKKKFKYLDYT